MSKDSDGSKDVKIYQSIEEFDKNLPHTVELIRTAEGDKVYVIGTAHFSRKSQDDVSLVMRNVKPGAVVLELCPLRLHILQFDEQTLLREAMDLNPEKVRQIFREQGMTNGMFYLNFLRTNANITKQLGVAPGGECRRAVAEAKKIEHCKVLLGDRRLDITLKRAMDGLTIGQKMMLTWMMRSQQNTKITAEEVETYKDRKAAPMQDMKQVMPSIYRAFVSERDIILAHSLLIACDVVKEYQAQIAQQNSGPAGVKVVGVVGMGHMSGILENFGKTKPEQVSELMKMPTKSWFGPRSNGVNPDGVTNIVVSWIAPYWPKFKKMVKVWK